MDPDPDAWRVPMRVGGIVGVWVAQDTSRYLSTTPRKLRDLGVYGKIPRGPFGVSDLVS